MAHSYLFGKPVKASFNGELDENATNASTRRDPLE